MSTVEDKRIRVGQWFQGPTDSGQGGWTAHQLRQAIGRPVTVAIRAPIPLETDLAVVAHDDQWHLVDPADPSSPILIATEWDSNVHFQSEQQKKKVFVRSASRNITNSTIFQELIK